jgi:uncharacterized repeat protein (TIGR01451 family)
MTNIITMPSLWRAPSEPSQRDAHGCNRRRAARPAALLASLLAALGASAQAPVPAPAPMLQVTTTAELEQVQRTIGGPSVKLLPADHVVPGDLLIYTLRVRNIGSEAVAVPQFVAPIPLHTSYVADSAVGPGAEVQYSVDAGETFDKPQNLKVHGEDGALRPSTAADYTHIRWTLKHPLKPKSVAYARFRARLN